jgi:hypothetical protein
MAVDNPLAGGEIDDAFPTWWKDDIRACPVPSPVDGGGGGATKAKREATPCWLSSESTAPAPQRRARRASISRLRRRQAPPPRNTPIPSKCTTPARSRRTCWASPSYQRQRCSQSQTRPRHRPSTESRGLDNEDRSPSRECFHVDLGGPGEGNHLGIPENGDPPRPVPRVDILRELAVVPVPAGGPDPQLEQIRERQARLDKGAGTLVPIRRDVGQEWAIQPPAGEARHLPQDIQHCIADDVRVRPPPDSSGVGQNLAAAALLLCAMPEPSTTKGRAPESPGGRRGPTGRKLCLPKAGAPLGTSRRDFPIHAGSIGPLRAHAQHSACGPGSPRQRALSSQLSGPPRQQGAPRLPPQAWGTLRQRGGSESFARTTRSAGFQPRHTTGTIPDPVPNPNYYHKVLGGDETGTVARGLSAGLPTGWNGR